MIDSEKNGILLNLSLNKIWHLSTSKLGVNKFRKCSVICLHVCVAERAWNGEEMIQILPLSLFSWGLFFFQDRFLLKRSILNRLSRFIKQ